MLCVGRERLSIIQHNRSTDPKIGVFFVIPHFCFEVLPENHEGIIRLMRRLRNNRRTRTYKVA